MEKVAFFNEPAVPLRSLLRSVWFFALCYLKLLLSRKL